MTEAWEQAGSGAITAKFSSFQSHLPGRKPGFLTQPGLPRAPGSTGGPACRPSRHLAAQGHPAASTSVLFAAASLGPAGLGGFGPEMMWGGGPLLRSDFNSGISPETLPPAALRRRRVASRSRGALGSWGHPFSSLFQNPAAHVPPCRPAHSESHVVRIGGPCVFKTSSDLVCPQGRSPLQKYLALPSVVGGVQTPLTAGLALYLGAHICEVSLITVPTPWTGLGIERFKACEELGCRWEGGVGC